MMRKIHEWKLLLKKLNKESQEGLYHYGTVLPSFFCGFAKHAVLYIVTDDNNSIIFLRYFAEMVTK